MQTRLKIKRQITNSKQAFETEGKSYNKKIQIHDLLQKALTLTEAISRRTCLVFEHLIGRISQYRKR